VFNAYFAVFPWPALPVDAVGFDLGCGSGRWARFVAPRVRTLHCIDASGRAIEVARMNLATAINCQFHVASVDALPLPDATMDFGYALGVLHHVPDTLAGIKACVAKLKPGAPLLLYLYYAFDNRPRWYQALWRASDLLRRGLCGLPPNCKQLVTTLLAALVYFPLARLALGLEKFGCRVDGLPLSLYRNRSFYTMRTDALDRFGTRLERRFRADQIQAMLHAAGLERISFSPSPPYWCVVGYKREDADTRAGDACPGMVGRVSATARDRTAEVANR
jgi:SAM-dependent methyltransferase